jgi:hypothetical protein
MPSLASGPHPILSNATPTSLRKHGTMLRSLHFAKRAGQETF